MAYIKIRTKYPCGYESEIKIFTLIGDMTGSFGKEEGCPLHGKKCKK